MVQHPVEIELSADLPGGQPVKLVPDRSAAEQVGLAALDFSSARPAQGQANLPVLVKPVRLVEKLGDLLHLVDNHLADSRTDRELLAEALGILEVAAVLLG